MFTLFVPPYEPHMPPSLRTTGLVVAPRPGNISQKWPKTYRTYDVTHKKKATKNYFSLQTWRLAEFFKGLNRSLAHSSEELWTCKDTCGINWLSCMLIWFR